MLKKIMFTFLILLGLYSTAAVVYRLFEPIETYHADNSTLYLDYSSLKEYVQASSEGSVHYLFFYASDDDASDNIKNTVLPAVENNTSLQFSKVIETVDITALVKNHQTYRLSQEWGLTSYPAFAAAGVSNGSIVVNHILEDSSDDPIDEQSLENWFIVNGLYQSTSDRK